jgi:membrane dipeptidase
MWVDRSEVGIGTRSNVGHVDIPRLQDGGVDCQVFAISSERSRSPSHPLRTALEMINRFYIECKTNQDTIVPVTNHSEILKAKNEGKIAAILSIEGAHIIECSIDMFSIFHRLGVRMVGLVHSLRNQLADGVKDKRTGGGLSELGIAAVETLEKLNTIIDVSHLNDEGFWDLVSITKNPFIASHSNCRTICEHPRNLTDEQIIALADKKGVIGMNFAPSFVHPNLASVQGVVDHIDHIVDLVGPNYVGLGSDFDGIPYTPVGLESVSKMPNITEELLIRDYSEADIQNILGSNHLRVFKEVIG